LQWYYKTKIVKPIDMDFSPARAFDEQDVINAIATEDSQQEPEKDETKTWIKRAMYMVFG
jgi:amino acid transporter